MQPLIYILTCLYCCFALKWGKVLNLMLCFYLIAHVAEPHWSYCLLDVCLCFVSTSCPAETKGFLSVILSSSSSAGLKSTSDSGWKKNKMSLFKKFVVFIKNKSLRQLMVRNLRRRHISLSLLKLTLHLVNINLNFPLASSASCHYFLLVAAGLIQQLQFTDFLSFVQKQNKE